MYHSFSLKTAMFGASPSAWVGPLSASLRATATRTMELILSSSKGRYELRFRETRPTVALRNIVRIGIAAPDQAAMMALLFVDWKMCGSG